jgi:hypothetical protein
MKSARSRRRSAGVTRKIDPRPVSGSPTSAAFALAGVVEGRHSSHTPSSAAEGTLLRRWRSFSFTAKAGRCISGITWECVPNRTAAYNPNHSVAISWGENGRVLAAPTTQSRSRDGIRAVLSFGTAAMVYSNPIAYVPSVWLAKEILRFGWSRSSGMEVSNSHRIEICNRNKALRNALSKGAEASSLRG